MGLFAVNINCMIGEVKVAVYALAIELNSAQLRTSVKDRARAQNHFIEVVGTLACGTYDWHLLTFIGGL